VEGNHLGFDLTILNLHLVPSEYDWDILTDTRQVTVPVRYIFVGDTGSHVEHDNGALALDVVSITEAAEFFLPSSIPNVELDGASVGMEGERMDFDSKGGNVFLLEFTG